MKRRKRWALGIVLLIAVALLTLPTIVLAGGGSSIPARSDDANARRATLSAENVRVDRRESFRRTRCSKTERRLEPGV